MLCCNEGCHDRNKSWRQAWVLKNNEFSSVYCKDRSKIYRQQSDLLVWYRHSHVLYDEMDRRPNGKFCMPNQQKGVDGKAYMKAIWIWVTLKSSCFYEREWYLGHRMMGWWVKANWTNESTTSVVRYRVWSESVTSFCFLIGWQCGSAFQPLQTGADV